VTTLDSIRLDEYAVAPACRRMEAIVRATGVGHAPNPPGHAAISLGDYPYACGKRRPEVLRGRAAVGESELAPVTSRIHQAPRSEFLADSLAVRVSPC
jgi:hypothetical protein